MGETGIWIAIFAVGVLALGVREYVRASGSFAARWEQVKLAFLAGALVILAVTAAILTVLFIAVIVLPEIWRPLLFVLAVFAMFTAVVWMSRRPSP
ncbi:MAG: hypothetical protein O2913_04755 [Chloroflexi bacterium]|nr:hypothetical protein [Chloroflexota bacterium]